MDADYNNDFHNDNFPFDNDDGPDEPIEKGKPKEKFSREQRKRIEDLLEEKRLKKAIEDYLSEGSDNDDPLDSK